MPSSSTSPSPPASPESGSGFEWQTTTPSDGEEAFVRALQCLGMDMAKAVPAKVQTEAITPLGTEPELPLLIGDFSRKTKERTLKPSCIYRFYSCFRILQHVAVRCGYGVECLQQLTDSVTT